MSINLVVHYPENLQINSFDRAIDKILSGEGETILVTPYFSIQVIKNICNKSTKIKFLTDLEEIGNNLSNISNLQELINLVDCKIVDIFDIPHLHAKLLSKGKKILIGSANFTNSGLGRNQEVSAIVDDINFATDIKRWISSLIENRPAITSNNLRNTFQLAPRTEKTYSDGIDIKNYQSSLQERKTIKVPRSIYAEKQKNNYSEDKVIINENLLAEIISSVFPNKEDCFAATKLVKYVISHVNDDVKKRILAITYNEKNAISLNIGQWKVLKFIYKRKKIITEFCIDFSDYSEVKDDFYWKLDLSIKEIDLIGNAKFDERWSDNKDFRLVSFPWNSEIVLTENLLQKWNTAINHSLKTFQNWKQSSYMKWHQSDLAEFFLKSTLSDIEQIYESKNL